MKVLITGATGLIGRILWRGLAGEHDLRGIDRNAPRRGEVERADLTRLEEIEKLFEGVEAVVDLAGFPDLDKPWQRVWQNNLPATMNVLEAARGAGVRRYVFASSNHVTGLYEEDEPYASIVAGRTGGLSPDAIRRIRTSDPIRPDSPYGLGKVFGEAAARYAAETGGPAAVCLRIGTVNDIDRPTTERHYATLLSHADLVRLVDRALRAPDDIRFAVHYGVSANTWRIWEIEDARETIGYVPEENAERFRNVA